jgi:hypothetical protein
VTFPSESREPVRCDDTATVTPITSIIPRAALVALRGGSPMQRTIASVERALALEVA